jgi:integrase
MKYRLPGDLKPRRERTEPPTDDEAEARRQLHVRLGENAVARVRRESVEDLTVNDLLDFYVLDCEDKQQPIQHGRVEPWRTLLGHARALDVQRDHLDAIVRRWRQVGPTWSAGQRELPDGRTLRWKSRDPRRVRPIGGASCNRLMSVLSRSYQLGREKRGLVTGLTFPHFRESARGEYISEEQSIAIRDGFLARKGRAVKADVFRLAYLLGIRKGQLRRTHKRNVLIHGDSWRLRWAPHEHKGGKRTGKPHEVVLGGEALDIVQRAWANRRPECDLLFHVDGQPVGPMHSEMKRTCQGAGHSLRAERRGRLPRHPALGRDELLRLRHRRARGNDHHRALRSERLQAVQLPTRRGAGRCP